MVAAVHPAASKTPCRKAQVVVLPFVPVTPATVRSRDGCPKRASATGPRARRVERHHDLRHIQVEGALGQDCDRPACDSCRREVVSITVVAGHAREQGTRHHPSRIHGQGQHLRRRITDEGFQQAQVRQARLRYQPHETHAGLSPARDWIGTGPHPRS